MFWLRAYLWKAFRMQECAIVLGSCSFPEGREKRPEERKRGKASVRVRRRWESLFLFVSPGVMMGEGETRME